MTTNAIATAAGQTSASGWNYDEAFKRNRGLISLEEQERLQRSRVAIPGMGGVGGIHLMTLARLGIGAFSIADGDEYEVANFNRQMGATLRSLGRRKVEVMAEEAAAINPESDIQVWDEIITEKNVDGFFADVDVFVDGVDFWSFDARRMLFREARERGIWAVTAGPIGMSTAWILFDPQGMTFDEYFDLQEEMTLVERFAAFLVGLTPQATQQGYLDLSQVQGEAGPSVALACQLAAGVVGAQVTKILLNRGPLQPAPHYAQFDAYLGKLVEGELPLGNRDPSQLEKRAALEKFLAAEVYGHSA